MQLTVNEFLIGGLQVPRCRLLVVLGGHGAVVLGGPGVRILLTHLHFGGRIACIGLCQQAGVNTDRRGRRGRILRD